MVNNKEDDHEALPRAKDIVEKKMRNGDYTGALEVAVKSRQLTLQLFKDMKKISQMRTVCEVHCAANKKLLGDEMDWYGILQVKPADDEATIKRQYSKLGRQLQPDENKFPGAEAAFKLIGDAQVSLLDQTLRRAHDTKRKESTVVKQPPTDHQTGNEIGITISTKCPYCKARIQYSIESLHRCLRCPTCGDSFFPYHFGAVPRESNNNTSPDRQPQKGCNQQRVMQTEKVHIGKRLRDDHEEEHNVVRRRHAKKTKRRSGQRPYATDHQESEENEFDADKSRKSLTLVRSNNNQLKQGRSTFFTKCLYCFSSYHYNTEFLDKCLRFQTCGKSFVAFDLGAVPGGASNNTISQPKGRPPAAESEFYNFNADKSREKFRVGQLWALYGDDHDHDDGLPKYYGVIKEIKYSNPVFKIRVRKLVPWPLKNNIFTWRDKKMPYCCGRFRIKKGSKSYSSTDSFSHQLKLAEEHIIGSIEDDEYALVLPRKGEIWALYRDWARYIKRSDLENWEYDIVQVMEETNLHIKVLVLELVNGFSSVFRVQVKGGSNVTVDIPQVELLSFSHQIPFFRLTEERNGSLRGFWELDPAALPSHYLS